MNRVTVQEVQQHVLELLADLNPGEELQITADEEVVGRLVAAEKVPRPPRQPGSAVGSLKIISEDDDHLQAFREYMP